MIPSKIQIDDKALSKYLSCEEKYPCLEPIMYSIDTFLPIVKLHQEEYWLPDDSKQNGSFYRAYLWLHIIFGWILTTIAVASFSGIVKKE